MGSAWDFSELTWKIILFIFLIFFLYSESSGTAVEIFNSQGLLPYLVSSLKTDLYPTTVAIPAGEVFCI